MDRAPSMPTTTSATQLPLVAYLAKLTAPKLILWCYLIWWVFTVALYFDPSPRLWISSMGLSAIIGTALYLSTAYGSSTKTQLERWQIIRLYVMPFCVSSFAALIKDRGFILVFHPTLSANLLGFGACAAFIALVLAMKRVRA
jgi:hypothetical protein